jgi:hypothetical protein
MTSNGEIALMPLRKWSENDMRHADAPAASDPFKQLLCMRAFRTTDLRLGGEAVTGLGSCE